MIRNLTPHDVSVYDEAGNLLETFPSQGQARVTQASETADTIDGIPTVRTVFGALSGLPEWSEGEYFIVSSITAQAAKAQGRRVDDLLLPGRRLTGPSGELMGCVLLSRYE